MQALPKTFSKVRGQKGIFREAGGEEGSRAEIDFFWEEGGGVRQSRFLTRHNLDMHCFFFGEATPPAGLSAIQIPPDLVFPPHVDVHDHCGDFFELQNNT